MIIYRKSKERDYNNIAGQLKKCGGFYENHLPHGFSAIATFDFGDIYIDDKLNSLLNDYLITEIEHCLSLFAKEDYGIVSHEEKDENMDNKYFGNGKNIVGRYETGVGVIEIKMLEAYTFVSLC